LFPLNTYRFNGFIRTELGILVFGSSLSPILSLGTSASFSKLGVRCISSLDGLWVMVARSSYGMIIGIPWGCWLSTFCTNSLANFPSLLLLGCLILLWMVLGAGLCQTRFRLSNTSFHLCRAILGSILLISQSGSLPLMVFFFLYD